MGHLKLSVQTVSLSKKGLIKMLACIVEMDFDVVFILKSGIKLIQVLEAAI